MVEWYKSESICDTFINGITEYNEDFYFFTNCSPNARNGVRGLLNEVDAHKRRR